MTAIDIISADKGERLRRKNRTRLEIVVSMLLIAEQGVGKTHLMYKGNLSFEVLHKYLELLTNADLLEQQQGKNKSIYKTTAKGLQFIKNYQELQKYAAKLDSLNNELEKFFPNRRINRTTF